MLNLSQSSSMRNNQHLAPSFGALALPLMDSLYSMALRMTRDQRDAEDLVQNSYLKALRFFYRFERGTNFRAWMFQILTNDFLSEYRKKRNREKRNSEYLKMHFDPFSTMETNATATFAEAGSSHFHVNYERLFDDTVTAALDRLSEEYRITLLLSDFGELKYKEIAEVLKIPVGTVMSRISRARKILARSLRSYAYKNRFVTTKQNKER